MGRNQTLTISDVYNFLIESIFPIKYKDIIEGLKYKASEATINRRLKELRNGEYVILEDGNYYVNDAMPPTEESKKFLEAYKKRISEGEREDSQEWHEYFELKKYILKKLKLQIEFSKQDILKIPLTRLVFPDKDFKVNDIPLAFNALPNMYDGLVQLIYSFIADCILNNPFLWSRFKENANYDFTIQLKSDISKDKRIIERLENHRNKCVKYNWLQDIRFSRHSNDFISPEDKIKKEKIIYSSDFIGFFMLMYVSSNTFRYSTST